MTQLNTLNSNINTEIGSVRNQVTSLQQVTSGNISSVRMDLSSRTTTLQQSISSVITSINNRLTSSVNLYQNCYQDTRSCRIDPSFVASVDNEIYKPYCFTSYLSIDVSVSSYYDHLLYLLATMYI